MDASHGPKRRGKIKNFAQLRPGNGTMAGAGGIDESFRAVRLGVRLLASSPHCGAIELIARRHFVARIASRLEVDAGEAEWGSVGIILRQIRDTTTSCATLSVEVGTARLSTCTSYTDIHTTCISFIQGEMEILPALVIVSASKGITTCNLPLGSMASGR